MLNLDTHILIYALAGKLRPRESRLLSEVKWSISAIVLWELAKLVQLSANLEASLAWILRKQEYDGMLEDGTPLEDIERAARNFSSAVVTDTRGKLRSVRAMFDRMADKNHEAIAQGNKAYSRLAPGTRQFGKLLGEMLGTKNDA